MKTLSLYLAAAVFFAAVSSAAEVVVAPAAGVFQYYETSGYFGPIRVVSKAGAVASLGFSLGDEVPALEAEVRFRRYGEREYSWGAEFRKPVYFHPAPVRPYLAPAAGYWRQTIRGRTCNLVGAGVRVGALWEAEGVPIGVDVFGAYRGQFNLGSELYERPGFYSELVAGGAGHWAAARWFGVRFAAELLWAGFFAEKHEGAAGQTFAPFVLVGPAFSF